MTHIPVAPVSGIATLRRCYAQTDRRWRAASTLLGVVSLTAACCIPLSISAAAPAAGDAYTYRLVNGYNREIVGQVRHEVTNANTAQGSVVSVMLEQPPLGLSHTEIQTQEGQWLRHRLDNHGTPLDYEFAPPLPALMLPLTSGRSWSVRVNAKVAAYSGSNRSVRIDGTVLGNERVRVPAGEFDTVKIRRIIYPGDPEFDNTETRIVEIDWYTPALGRSVRSETRSNWMLRNCFRHCDRRGDWNVLELTEVSTAPR